MVNGAQKEGGKLKPKTLVMLPMLHTGLVPGLVEGKWLLGAAQLPQTWTGA